MRIGKGGAALLVAAMITGTAGTAAEAGTGTITFTDRGTHVFVVPQGTTWLSARAVGAAGRTDRLGRVSGGRGARATGTLTGELDDPGRRLVASVEVGGGRSGPASESGDGGGASDVRACGASACSLGSRVLVAGGGGGAGYYAHGGGDAGTPAPASAGAGGGSRVCGDQSDGGGGGGGTETAGGAPGAAGEGGSPGVAGTAGSGGDGASGGRPPDGGDDWGAGGGGGGWFGGGGGGSGGDPCQSAGGGGGGSSHADQAVGAPSFALTTDPAQVSFTFTEEVAPSVTVSSPATGGTVRDLPDFGGTGGQDTGDLDVVLEVRDAFGDLVQMRSAPVLGDGTWTNDPASVPDGAYTARVLQSDVAGNTSVAVERTFTVDATPPAAPVVIAPANGSVGNDATPTASGTAEPASTVDVLVDGASVGTATADGAGNWSQPLPALWDGSHAVRATATDAAANVSEPSNFTTFTVDTVAPAIPAVTSPAGGAVIGTEDLHLRGTAEAQSVVAVSIDGSPVGPTGQAIGDGTFTTQTPIAEGTHTYVVRATDAAGNTSDPSAERTVVVDRTSPQLRLGALSGRVRKASVAVTVGTATGDQPARWEAFRGGVRVASGDVGTSGPLEPAGLPDGELRLTVTQRDHAGNEAATSRTFTLDTTPPAVALDAVAAGDRPSLAGTAGTATGDLKEVRVELRRGDTLVESLTGAVGQGGAFAVQPSVALAPGSYVAKVLQRDDLGNEGSAQRSFTIEAPPAPQTQVAGATQTAAPPRTLAARVVSGAGKTAARRIYGASCARRVAATVRVEVPAASTVAVRALAGRKVVATKVVGVPKGRTVIAVCLNKAGLAKLRRDRRGRLRPLSASATVGISAAGYAPEARTAALRFTRR